MEKSMIVRIVMFVIEALAAIGLIVFREQLTATIGVDETFLAAVILMVVMSVTVLLGLYDEYE